MRIGIFGGSFNPPHKMHLKMALELLEKNYIDKVIYVPTGSKYKYKTNLVEDKHRYNMLKLMVQGDERFEVSDYELKDYVVYTCESLAYFKEMYPEDEIYFICGADNLSYIDEWKNGLQLLKDYKILVVKRDGQNIEELLERFINYRKNILVTDIVPNELSSTFIRTRINEGDVSEYLDKEVLEYIKENNLYRGD